MIKLKPSRYHTDGPPHLGSTYFGTRNMSCPCPKSPSVGVGRSNQRPTAGGSLACRYRIRGTCAYISVHALDVIDQPNNKRGSAQSRKWIGFCGSPVYAFYYRYVPSNAKPEKCPCCRRGKPDSLVGLRLRNTWGSFVIDVLCVLHV